MVRNYKSYEPKDVKQNAHPEKSLYQKHNNQQGCYLYFVLSEIYYYIRSKMKPFRMITNQSQKR